MTHLTKLATSASVMLLTLGVLSSSAAAITVNPTRQAQNQQQVQERCGLVTQRVELIITRYDTNKEQHVEHYQDVSTRVQEAIDRLEGQNYDLTELKNDLAHLNSLRIEFAGEYTNFVNKLRESRDLVCGNSESAYRHRVEESREHLRKAREISLEIRTFILSDIRPDLQDIRAQVENNN